MSDLLCGSCRQPLPALYGVLWHFVISLPPPSQNKVSGNKGGHKAQKAYKKYRDDYQFLLQVWKNQLKIPDATGRRRVHITRLFKGKAQKYDRGNLIGGCKPLLDAMTRCNLLVDDKEEFVEDHYDQERGKETGVRIIIQDMPCN